MVLFKEWPVPKTPPHQLGAGAAPQGHLPKSPWGNSPELPGTPAHISPHRLTAVPCHSTSKGSHVCAWASHGCPHRPPGETSPPDPTACSWFSLHKWDSALAYQFIFYHWCIILFWRIRLRLHCQSSNTEVATPQFCHSFSSKAGCCCLE